VEANGIVTPSETYSDDECNALRSALVFPLSMQGESSLLILCFPRVPLPNTSRTVGDPD
jgi:hypothetical protein